MHIEAGAPVVILAGSHIGCIQLVADRRIRSVLELKGKTVAVLQLRSDEHYFISMFAARVGLDPQDINWVIVPFEKRPRLLEEGKIDAAFMGLDIPGAQELRDKKIANVLVDTTIDKPWSEYFCCMVTSTREFVGKHPVATKRALRAIIKGADLCALEPERTARRIVERVMANYDVTLQLLKGIPYGQWREYDAEDTVRFFALWMREAGLIKSSPQKIIADGTDWRFLNELKRELKA
jgi:NitT/TauT family transport system substrate-binding protein